MAIDALVLNRADNVATSIQNLDAGTTASVQMERQLFQVQLLEDIPYGHKFTIRLISRGENILKYGQIIGRATSDIPAGCHAHVQNIESLRGRGDLKKEG